MYEELSQFYDELMSDVDYDEWASQIVAVLRKELPHATCGLDLACGSGNFTVRLAKNGYKMIGADPSEEMLTIARSKSNRDIAYICQAANDLALLHTVDFVTMMCDGMNYCVEDVRFDKIAKALKPRGLFVFDVSGYGHLSETLGDNLYFEDRDDLSYFWQNEFDSKRNLLTLRLTFFKAGEDGRYDRFDEEQTMRAYKISELVDVLNPLFEVRVCGEDLSSTAADDCRRIHFICRKK